MLKRDWKLPNLSYFTYTSIVQLILHSFWELVLSQMIKWFVWSIVYKKWDKNGIKSLVIAKYILFYINKHCIAYFLSKYFILHNFWVFDLFQM